MDKIDRAEILRLLNKSVVRPVFPSYHGADDFRCMEVTFDMETFAQLERLLGSKITGRKR